MTSWSTSWRSCWTGWIAASALACSSPAPASAPFDASSPADAAQDAALEAAQVGDDAAEPDTSVPFNFGAACDPYPDAGDSGADANTCEGFLGAQCFPLDDGGGTCSVPCSSHDWQIECEAQLLGSCGNDAAFCAQ